MREEIQNIRRQALTSQDEELVAQMIPDVECHGDVFIGDDESVLDCTRTFETDDSTQDRTSELSVWQLTHYRLVLTPVMQKSIEHEMSIPIIFEALAHAAGCKHHPAYQPTPSDMNIIFFRFTSDASDRMGPPRCQHWEHISGRSAAFDRS